jgi:DNA-binding MarR family transcriptional regulator
MKQRLQAAIARMDHCFFELWHRQNPKGQGGVLSVNEYHYLYRIKQMETPSLSNLAESLHVTRPSASVMAKKLESRGLIHRGRCTEDARSLRLQLTEQGRTLLSEDDNAFLQLAEAVQQVLNDDEAQTLTRLLEKANAGVSALKGID